MHSCGVLWRVLQVVLSAGACSTSDLFAARGTLLPERAGWLNPHERVVLHLDPCVLPELPQCPQ